jgi:hypothetical protein
MILINQAQSPKAILDAMNPTRGLSDKVVKVTSVVPYVQRAFHQTRKDNATLNPQLKP